MCPRNRGKTIGGIVARYDHILSFPFAPAWLFGHQECEYALPIAKAADGIEIARKLIKDNHYTMTLPVEVRFVAEDDTMLSPAYKSDVCYIGANTAHQPS